VRRLGKWAGFEVPQILPFEAVHEKLLAALFRTPSRIAVVMITDLFGTTQRFNVPGAVSDGNWSARLAQTTDGWRGDEELVGTMERISAVIRETAR
jgi:4-alpha-glucanotransferase